MKNNFIIGCDIEEIKRFEGENQEFYDEIFTKNEQEYCFSKAKPSQHFAARFCAKESVIKSLCSLGITKILYKDIEIYHNEYGAPMVKTSKNICDKIDIRVSMSHCNNYAMANALVVENGKISN